MSFASESRDRARPVVPLAAMVDIMFLLLVVFMTASYYREQDQLIDVSLPATETDEPQAGKAPIIITVKADGSIYVGEGKYTLESLYATLSELAAQLDDESVVIRGDQTSDLGRTVQVLDICRKAGIRDVSLATTKSSKKL